MHLPIKEAKKEPMPKVEAPKGGIPLGVEDIPNKIHKKKK